MKRVRIEIVAHVPDETTEDHVRRIFHGGMDLYSKSAAIHLDLNLLETAQGLMKKRERLTMTEFTVLDELADV